MEAEVALPHLEATPEVTHLEEEEEDVRRLRESLPVATPRPMLPRRSLPRVVPPAVEVTTVATMRTEAALTDLLTPAAVSPHEGAVEAPTPATEAIRTTGGTSPVEIRTTTTTGGNASLVVPRTFGELPYSIANATVR